MQSKRAQGEKAHLPVESGPEKEENKDKPKSNHFSTKALHRSTIEAQRSALSKMGQFVPNNGAAAPRGWPSPFLTRSSPNFVGCFLPPLQTSVGCVSWKKWCGKWQFAQGRKACKKAQLHSISTIHPMMVWSKGCGEEAHGSLTWRIEWPPLLSTYKYPLTPSHSTQHTRQRAHLTWVRATLQRA
jgi:hypothetical protein